MNLRSLALRGYNFCSEGCYSEAGVAFTKGSSQEVLRFGGADGNNTTSAMPLMDLGKRQFSFLGGTANAAG